MSLDHVRAFVALPTDAAMRDRIAALVCDLQPRVQGVRWVAADAWHVTLRFLGESSPPSLQLLEARLREAAAACPRGEASVSGLGLFPERGAPRVLWLGVSLPPALLALQARCEEEAVAAGFARETRPFRSHLTLGRWRDRAPRPELPAALLGPLPMESLVLMRSELRPPGAVYTPLATLPLA